jgi:hypothetical protein
MEAGRRLGLDGRTVRRYVAGKSPVPLPVELVIKAWLSAHMSKKRKDV